jgi:hypothetical protein
MHLKINNIHQNDTYVLIHLVELKGKNLRFIKTRFQRP